MSRRASSYERPWRNKDRAKLTAFGGKNVATWTGKLHRVAPDGTTIEDDEDVVVAGPVSGSPGHSGTEGAREQPPQLIVFVGSEC